MSQQHFMQEGIKDALLSKLQPQESYFIERIRGQLKGKNIGEALRKFSRDNKD